MTARLKPFFSYFGAKYNLAPKYPAPRHDFVIEWFAGSAQYALFHHTKQVFLIEAYAPVAELWRYLIGAKPEEILALPDLQEGQKVDDLGLPQGPAYLIGFWCNQGCARPCQSLSRWHKPGSDRGINGGLFWGARVRQRIASQLSAIRHWKVFEGRCEDMQPEQLTATHFVDPPYTAAGKAYGVSGVDYLALAERCRAAKGQVIVCEAEGADWLPFTALSTANATTRRNGRNTSKEKVWCSP